MRLSLLKLSLILLPLTWWNLAYAQDGIGLDFFYVGEGVSNVQGGAQKNSAYLGTGDVSITLDTEMQGGVWFAEGLMNHGRDPSGFVGDMQTASNIADKSRVRLQQFWYQQTLSDDVSVLVGRHDLNSEFYTSEYASLFINSSFGIGPDLSGNVPTSIWPEAGLGARLAITFDKKFLFRTAIYDGDPSTSKVDSSTEGLFWISEVNLSQGKSEYKWGIWQHSADKIAPNGNVVSSDYGSYMVVDQEVSGDVGVFVQLGITPQSRNDISNYLGLGMHLKGLFSALNNDLFGIAVARAGFSSGYRNANNLKAAETTIEITYDMPFTQDISIHPAYQWIQHPSGDSSLKAAHVAILRFEVSL
ncbi:MAG: carbohydrate porin [Ghiorsea sp.]